MDVVWTHAKHLPEPELVQGAMAAFAAKWEEEGLNYNLDAQQLEAFTPRIPQVAEEMLHSYIETRYSILQGCTLLSAEGPFAVPLPNLSKSWYVGRLDKVIEYQGQKIIIEHKTTTEYKKDGGFKSAYLEGWYSDAQCKGYQYGGALYYPGLTQVWVDAALVHKTVHDAFRFVPIAHSFPMLKEWIDDTESWIKQMQVDEHKFRAAGDRLTPGVFRKNENQCFGKFGTCPYLDICRTTPDPSVLEEPPEGYIIERWSPFDTLGIDKILNGEQTV
jgi:hypothetical protein